MERRVLGQYIVMDPRICHGRPTFCGTRIFVAAVLEQVAEGVPWERIIEDWHGSITMEAISEAVLLARQAFLDQSEAHRTATVSA